MMGALSKTLLVAALIALTVEAAARFLSPDVAVRQEGPAFPVVQHNAFLGYRPVPGESGDGWRTNLQGMRSDMDCPTPKNPLVFRIFLTGGSAAWGSHLLQDQTVAAALERRLQVPGKTVRVYTAACGGWTSTQERILTHNALAGLEPDLVVSFSLWNDAYFSFWGEPVLIDHDFMHLKRRLSDAENFRQIVDGEDAMPKQQDYISRSYYLLFVKPFVVMPEATARSRYSPDTVARHWLWNMRLMGAAVKVLPVIQPSLETTTKILTPEEMTMKAQFRGQYVGFADYQREVYAKASKHALVSDAALARVPGTAFLDYVHLTPEGAEAVGAWLADKMMESAKEVL